MRNLLAAFLGLLIAPALIAQHSVVAPVLGSVLIKGIHNYVQIGLPGIEADSIMITAHHSKIRKENNWLWTVKPDTSYTEETIIVTAWRKNKLVLKDSTSFKLKWCPDPVAFIGNHTGTNDTTTKELLVASLALTTRALNFEMDAAYEVVHFAMVINDGPAVYLNNSLFLSELQKSVILKTKSGDLVHFYGILVKYPDGRFKTVNGITLTIK